MAKWFLKNHDFIHVNGSVAGKYNKHKQDGSHLRFPIRMILATVDLQVISILPMNFESTALSFQEKKFKTDFQDRRHGRNFGFPIATMLPTKFRVNWNFSSAEEGKIDFQDGHHLGFPIGTILAIFISTSHPNASYQFSNQLALWFRKISEKKRVSRWQPFLDFRSKQLKLF